MKKILITLVLGLIVLAGCATPSTNDETTMDKTDEMTEEKMTDEEMVDEEMTDEMASHTNDGEMAPSFVYMDLDGNEVKLSDFEGKKLYIKYWASWCPICLSGLERLDEFFAEVDEDSDFQLLTVVTPGYNNEGSEEDFREWFSGLEYKNIKVVFDTDGKYAKEFNVRAVPTSIFIGSDGVLIQSIADDKGNDNIKYNLESFN